MPRIKSSLSVIVILVTLVGLLGIGLVVFNSGGGGTLKGGVITDEINCPLANISDDFNLSILESNVSAPQILWNITWGGAGIDRGTAVAVDNNGYVYCTGRTRSYGEGDEDLILIKLYSNGTEVWHSTWGGVDSDWGDDVAVDGDGSIYCVGTTASFGENNPDLVLVKFHPNGSIVWNKSVNCGGYGDGVAIDPHGYIYCVGRTHMSGQWLLVKFHPNGTKIWHKLWGGPNGDVARDIVIDSNGYIYCTGRIDFSGSGTGDWGLVCFSPNGVEIWKTAWGTPNEDFGFAMTIDANGSLYCTGYMGANTTTRPDLALVKFHSNGIQAWNSSWGMPFGDAGYGVGLDASGSIYCVGPTQNQVGTHDFVLMKFYQNGTIAWNTTWGGSNEEVGSGLAIDGDGSVYCIGRTNSFGAGDYDLALIKYRGDFESGQAPQDEIPPEKVTGLIVTEEAVENCLSLAWDPCIAPDFWYYKIYRSTLSGFIPGPTNFLASSTINDYIDINLIDGTSYSYRVSAVDELLNEGAFSNEVVGRPQGATVPGQVYGLIVTNPGIGNRLDLSWTENSAPDVAYYRVYRSTVSGGPYTNIVNQSSNWFIDSGLTDGTTYYYVISAVDEVQNEGIYSREASAVPLDCMAPGKVTNVAIAVVPAGNALNLTWTASAATDLANYKVYRSTISGFTPSGTNLIASPVTNQYLDSGLTDGTTYYYRIAAVDEGPNEGTRSDEASQTPADTEPPAKVEGVCISAIASGNALSLSWTANTEPDLNNYMVYRSFYPGFTPGPTNLVGSPSSNNFYDSGLIDGITYYYRIRGVDEVPNLGPVSDEVSETPYDPVAPAKVLGVSVTVIPTGNQVNLTWTASTATDFDHYKVYRSTTSGFTPGGTNLIATPSINYYVDSGLTDGIFYYYRISAVDEVPNEGPYSDEVVVGSIDTVAPEQVIGVSTFVVAEGNALTLSWNAGSAPDLVEYRIYRSTTSGGPYTNIANCTTNYYTDLGLTDGTTYYYVVSAVDEVPNEGFTSHEASATPRDTVAPAKVTGVRISVVSYGNAIEITWDASAACDLDHYNIYRSTISGFTPSPTNLIATPLVNYYLDTDINEDITYYYRVSAVDEAGNVGTSSSNNYLFPVPVEPPEKVTGVTVTVIATGNKLNLTWTASTASDVAGYQVYRSTTSGFTPGPTNFIASVTQNYYLDSGLTDGTTFYYRIRAYDEVPNLGTASDEVSGIPADTTPPGQVYGLIVTNPGTGNTLQLSWIASTAPDFEHYNIYRNGTLLTTRVITSYYDTGLIDNALYVYEVSAVDEVPNEGLPSCEVGGIPTDITPPAQITGLSISVIPSMDALEIAWTACAASDFDHYNIYRSTTNSSFTPSPENLVANTTVNYYLDTNLEMNTGYYYRISAVDEAENEGAPSVFRTGSPGPDPTPPVVTGLTITVVATGNQLNLQWDNLSQSIPDLLGYNIYRSTVSGFTPGPANHLTMVDRNWYNDTGLCDGTTYYYKVTAVDDDNNEGLIITQVRGTPSDTVAPTQVTGVIVKTDIEGNTLSLNWNSTGEDTAGYRIYRNSTNSPFFILTCTPHTNYSDSGLVDGVAYWYKISAYDEIPNYGANATATTGIPQDSIAPARLTGINISIVPDWSYITLSWSPSTSPDIYGYNIYRSTYSDFSPSSSTFIANTTSTFYEDSNLDGTVCSVSYQYIVTAEDDNGNEGEASEEITLWEQCVPYIRGYSQIEVDCANGEVNISVTLNYGSSGHLVSWGDFAREGNTFLVNVETWMWTGIVLDVLTSDSHIYKLGYLEAGIYTFTFKCWDTVVESQSFTVWNRPPQKVASLEVFNVGLNRLNISWALNPEPNIAYYNVYRSTVSNFTIAPSNLIASSTSYFYTDVGLTEGQTYYYRVTAVDDCGNEGAPSEEGVNCPIDILSPEPPIVESAIVAGDLFLLISSIDVDVAYLNVYGSQTSGGPYELIKSYDFTMDPMLICLEMPASYYFYYDDSVYMPQIYPDSLTIQPMPMPEIIPDDPIINPPEFGSEFNYNYYIITAVDENGNESPPSNEINFEMPCYPPTWVDVVDNGNGDLLLSWENDYRNNPDSISGYQIYRMDVAAVIPELIATINSPEIKSYMDYGVPNGEWRYFITILNHQGAESYLSESCNVTVADTVGPGASTSLYFGIARNHVNISWIPPTFLNMGADIAGYEIVVMSIHSPTFRDIFSHVILTGNFWTSYYFGYLPSGFYEVVIWAFDDNGNDGNPASLMLDLREPICPSLITPPPNVIAAHRSLEIRVKVNGLNGIQDVFLNYTVDRELPQTIRMNLVESFSNGTMILRGEIPGQPAGVRVNYCIIVVDLYGYSTSSSSFSYLVSVAVSNCNEGVPWWIIFMFIVVIGAFASAAVATIKVFMNLNKERKIKAILEKVVSTPICRNFDNIEVLTSHNEYPRVIIENPFEPTNFSLEYYHHQDYAGQSEGFEFSYLLRVFNSILREFPTLNHYFEQGLNKLLYLMKVKSLPYEEQIEVLKAFITQNSDTEIRLQLNKLMVELNTSDDKEHWEYLLPEFNRCFDLSQILDDPEFNLEVLLMAILIKCQAANVLL